MSMDHGVRVDYTTFFQKVTDGDFEPYPYQTRLGVEPWPELLDVPTGLGKTAAITVAWLFKQLHRDPATPRRLLWCLPMRVLVEQTRDNVKQWLANATPFFEKTGGVVPTHHVLMGGETDDAWIRRPEDPTIVIGTQDMLLSRALMRGYGMSRYRWPIDFALVHHDALWVFDEVQLMGAGLATSAQLEAFRRDLVQTPGRSARSLWVSATLRDDWLDTVDFRPHVDGLTVARLSDDEKKLASVRRRREARKAVRRAGVTLQGGTRADAEAYVNDLAQLVHEEHRPDGPTLIIVNNVERAQNLTRRLQRLIDDDGRATNTILVHARFRQAEREQINKRIVELGPADDTIVIATQAIEAGVDLTSKRLFTELAPWSSLVQRFGRCNRGGEYNDVPEGATIYWIDIDTDSGRDLGLPYDEEPLARARGILNTLSSAAPADLPPVDEERPLSHVIRRKDFLELFNTDPDLSGHDIDISHYLRDSGQPQLQVFWREFDDTPGEQNRPARVELCPVSISQLRQHVGKDADSGFVWDALSRRWEAIGEAQIRPGQVVMLRAADGGYDQHLGFVPHRSGKRHPMDVLASDNVASEAFGDDVDSHARTFVTLADHSLAVRTEAKRLCDGLGEIDGLRPVLTAALWHDVGKAHPAAQTAYRDFLQQGGSDTYADTHADMYAGQLWAKTPGHGYLRYRVQRNGEQELRRHFRHELASALAWLEHGPKDEWHDLIAYLIASHHGRVRLGLRALPNETVAPDDRKFARGVWEGDVLPPVVLNGVALPETSLRLDVMEMGDGPMGPSWIARTRRLLREYGPFRLAWLEMLVRLADWRASAQETDPENTEAGMETDSAVIETNSEAFDDSYKASGEVAL